LPTLFELARATADDLTFCFRSGYENATQVLHWLQDHETSSVAANKPVIHEDTPFLTVFLCMTAKLLMISSTNIFFHLNQSINGDMTWGSIVVDSVCPGYDFYAICPPQIRIILTWLPIRSAK
jgi:hypothetical protein